MKVFNLQNEIIDILTDENTNFKDVVVALAKRNPEILYAIVKGDNRLEFEARIYNNYSDRGHKVQGVKLIREKYPHMGLKEAVDYFNEIMDKFSSEVN